MVQGLKSRCSGKVLLFVSDELSHYKTVLVEAFSHFEPVPRTVKAGHPINPVKVLNDDLM
jgi:hypothetical protein